MVASIVGTLSLFIIKGADQVSLWLLFLLFAQGLLVHFIIVPLVLKTGFKEGIVAQALAILMYMVVLSIALLPVILHARKSVKIAVVQNDLREVYESVRLYSLDHDEVLPSRLAQIDQQVYIIPLSKYHSQSDIRYLPEYVMEHCKRQGSTSNSLPGFRLGMHQFHRMSEDVLLWSTPESISRNQVVVCFADRHTEIVSKNEFEKYLDDTIKELRLERIQE